jgi:hypothetical protein
MTDLALVSFCAPAKESLQPSSDPSDVPSFGLASVEEILHQVLDRPKHPEQAALAQLHLLQSRGTAPTSLEVLEAERRLLKCSLRREATNEWRVRDLQRKLERVEHEIDRLRARTA